MGKINTRQRAETPVFPRDKRGFQPYKARDRPVSGFLRKPGLCTIRRNGCHGKEIAVAFLQKFGGSKVKRDKGGMPGEPGHRQKLRQAKGLPPLKGCYGFEIWLRCVCQSEGKDRCCNAFSETRKVLPGVKQPDPGFPNFLRTV